MVFSQFLTNNLDDSQDNLCSELIPALSMPSADTCLFARHWEHGRFSHRLKYQNVVDFALV
jgi:hypothetical protein